MRAFNFQKGMNFPIDMGTLFSIKNPEFGKIVPDYLDGNVFYELYNHKGEKICNDGEKVQIRGVMKKYIMIQNSACKWMILTRSEAELCFWMGLIRELWLEFGDVPMNPETECLEAAWEEFPIGTNREEVWQMFLSVFYRRLLQTD